MASSATANNTDNNALMSKEAFRLEVLSADDDGIRFDIDPQSSIYQLMQVICSHWLEKFRPNGDGGIDDHLWKIFRDSPFKHMPIPPQHNRGQASRMDDDESFGDGDGEDSEGEDDEGSWRSRGEDDDIDMDWDKDLTEEEADRIYEENMDKWREHNRERCEGLQNDLKLENLPWFTPGLILNVVYDFCRGTAFKIRFDSIQQTKKSLPYILPSLAEELAKTFVPYKPPPGSRNIDDIYPLANNIMFASGEAMWVCPYPTSKTSAGFVEGGQEYGSDIVYLAVTSFSGLHEALVAIEEGMRQYPNPKRVSRMMFPIKLDESYEEDFQDAKKRFEEFVEFKKSSNSEEDLYTRDGLDFQKFGKLSENIQYQLMCPDLMAILRVTPEDLTKYENVLEKTFPLCVKAYHQGRWASFRRGRVLISEGHDTGERGIPTKILAQVATPELNSLHDFLCVCEALFQKVEANSIYSSLQKSAQNDPAVFANSSNKRIKT